MKRPARVRVLATESGFDLDEVLVRLWDAGINEVIDADGTVPTKLVKRARLALGLGRGRVLESYWRTVFMPSKEPFEKILTRLGISHRVGARRLPKGAAAKLQREALRQNLLVLAMPRQDRKSDAELPYFVWHAVETESAFHYLSEDEVVGIHNALVEDFAASSDPIVPSGIKNPTLLASAIARPETCNGDTAKYPTVGLAAAALLHSLAQNHAFHNGNKRTALVSMLVFLDRHNIIPTCDEDELFKMVLQVAQHSIPDTLFSNRADAEVSRVAEWLDRKSRIIEKAERPLPWRKLKQILAQNGCSFDYVGNSINISRTITKKKSFWRTECIQLKTQVAYGGDGREVQRNTIGIIRRDLELDEAHGIDSRIFYDEDPLQPGDFIIQYRKTLRRLGRL